MIRLTATRPAGALLGLMTLGVLTGCSGPPADDPSSALRAVCGEDAEIVEQDDHPLDGLLSGERLAPEINSEQDAFFSGNGVTLGWATSEDVDNTHGILVEILPLDDGEADTTPFEPLEDDGRETGLGYPED